VRASGIDRVGVLASESAYVHGVYARPLTHHGIHAVLPTTAERASLVRIVRDIMGGRRTEADRRAMLQMVRRMRREDDVQGVIIGCTELSVVLPASRYPVPAYDAMDALARAAVTIAYSAGEVPRPAALSGLVVREGRPSATTELPVAA
jgi:aspartate racemase